MSYSHYSDAYAGPPRVTAYAYVYNRGLMHKYGTIEWLWELVRRAASSARWLGIEPVYVYEGPYVVNTWPEDIWENVIAQLEQAEKTAFADAATSQDDPDWGSEGDGDVTVYPGPQGEQASWDIGL